MYYKHDRMKAFLVDEIAKHGISYNPKCKKQYEVFTSFVGGFDITPKSKTLPESAAQATEEKTIQLFPGSIDKKPIYKANMHIKDDVERYFSVQKDIFKALLERENIPVSSVESFPLVESKIGSYYYVTYYTVPATKEALLEQQEADRLALSLIKHGEELRRLADERADERESQIEALKAQQKSLSDELAELEKPCGRSC